VSLELHNLQLTR